VPIVCCVGLAPNVIAHRRARARFRVLSATREAESLAASEVEWTLIRVPGLLVDGEGGDVAVSLTLPRDLPRPAQRQAVARVMLDAVLERK
jgi:hypothetical protein